MASNVQRSDAAVLLRAEHAVVHVLAGAVGEDEAHPRLLEAIGTALGWDVGAYWEPTGQPPALRCRLTWRAPTTEAGPFLDATRALTLAPGTGLPGQVWQSGRPAWVPNAEAARHLPRADAAARSGLQSAFAVPVRGTGAILGVMELFSRREREPDEDLLSTMASLGSQIGQFVERCRAQEAVRASEARKGAILNAAFDCIITMDGDGRIVEVNAATETTFGYSEAQMVGSELAELMIPPSLRGQHRRGLARYMQTGASHIVGHPVELVAMRSDGTEFPVELAVTRPELPGPPLFCGYLRDVTARHEAERALRQLADEQAALRRVATAVAAEIDEQALFALVTEEVAHLLGAERANVMRFEEGGMATAVGSWTQDAEYVPPGTTVALDGDTASRLVLRTGRPARVDSYEGVGGATAEQLRALGLRAAVGAPVVLAGRLWGALTVATVRPEPFPPGAEERLASFAELAGQALANAHARAELGASRARIVAAGDAERRRLERNLHDGAQQRLIAASLSLRMAARRLADGDVVRAALEGVSEEVALALEELRELARGLHPAILSDHGLRAAIEALCARAPVPVELEVALTEPLPRPVEAAAYYVVAEALTNVAKYACASHAHVRVARANGLALVEVGDDGVGGADPDRGSGLRGLGDRVEALGGRLAISSPNAGGTAVHAEIPAP